MSKLLPVVNVRPVDPRCCLTCKHGRHDGSGGFDCEREGGPQLDAADIYAQTHTVCDRWTEQEGSARRTPRKPHKPKSTAGEESWSLLLAFYFGDSNPGLFGVLDDFQALHKLISQVIRRHTDEIPDDLAARIIERQCARDAAQQELVGRALTSARAVDAAPL